MYINQGLILVILPMNTWMSCGLPSLTDDPQAKEHQGGHPFKRLSTNPGFTLIELLVTIGIFAIVMTVAVPSFNSMMMNSDLSTTSSQLVNGLYYARNTALSQSEDVQLCPLSAPGSTTCGTNWSNGWIIVTQPGTNPVLILANQLSITGPSLKSTAASVTFDKHGLASNQANFTLCDNRGNQYAHSVEVMATGFIQAGNVNGLAAWDNSALTCP